jgi:hypothetical protein
VLTVKSREGANVNVTMTNDVRLTATVRASLADLKPNTYIGVTAMPQADGSQKRSPFISSGNATRRWRGIWPVGSAARQHHDQRCC